MEIWEKGWIAAIFGAGGILFSWEWYGLCEEDKSVFSTFGHDVRSCVVNWELNNFEIGDDSGAVCG